jgi:hypothetical protein
MRLSDERLAALEEFADRTTYYETKAIATELRERRAADLSKQDVSDLKTLSFLLNKHHREPYCYEGEEIDAALEVLERLTKGSE